MVLGPLLEINPDEREMLLHTLATYFAVQGSAAEAGRRLYCHPNTVRHRLRRIERQTGRSLDDPLASAELCVALEALRRLPDPPRPTSGRSRGSPPVAERVTALRSNGRPAARSAPARRGWTEDARDSTGCGGLQ